MDAAGRAEGSLVVLGVAGGCAGAGGLLVFPFGVLPRADRRCRLVRVGRPLLSMEVRRCAGVVGAAALFALAGCSATVSLRPAPEATRVGCAAVVVRLPAEVAGQQRRDTNAQGTGAWGSPVAAVLRCGVPVSGPTTRPCFTFEGVDWVAQSTSGRRVRFDTFGRSPQLEAVIDGSRVNPADVLAELSVAVRPAVPSSFMRCLGSSSPAR